MKIEVVKVGKPAFSEYNVLVSEYEKRLTKFTNIINTFVKAHSGVEKNASTLKSVLEWDKNQKNSSCFVVALDERGKELSSIELSNKIKSCCENPALKKMVFLIGGPYGISDEIKSNCDFVWCLSKLVLPSDLAWLVAWEQIYRAFTILNGMPYHHE